MDIDLFRDGEHFSTFDSHEYLDDNYPDDSTSLDGINNFTTNMYEWDMENEREINGDLALIPMSSSFCASMSNLSNSPPSREDFNRIMSDWQQLITIDPGVEEIPAEIPVVASEENNDETAQQKASTSQETSAMQAILDLPDDNKFDITTYINGPDFGANLPPLHLPTTSTFEENFPVDTSLKVDGNFLSGKPTFKAGVKKIDLKAQRYIVEDDDDDEEEEESDAGEVELMEDDHVDVETVSDSENSPVLEAGDLNSLLEQFEATEMPDLPGLTSLPDDLNISLSDETFGLKVDLDDVLMNDFTENNSLDDLVISKDILQPVVAEVVKNDLPPTIFMDAKIESKPSKTSPPKSKIVSQTKTVAQTKIVTKPKTAQVKIEEKPLKIATPPTIKQKTTLITTKPSTKTLSPQTKDSTTSTTPDLAKNKLILDSLPQELIARIKESGKRKPISVIPPIPPCKKRGAPRTHDPIVQLPRNKIIKLISNKETVHLDHDYCSHLTPYPKNPQKDSGFESAEEDDRSIIRSQPMVKNADGKLMVSLLKVNTIRNNEVNQKKKLNLEEYKKRREGVVLKSSGNSLSSSPFSSNCSSPLPEDENIKRLRHQEKLMKMAKEVLNTPPKSERKVEEKAIVTKPPQPILIPADMEVKTLVSIGVNTDDIQDGKNSLAPVEQLEAIKPLLQKVSAKINCNSLITSLIENIPKVINKSKITANRVEEDGGVKKVGKKEHGEDKTIVYLPKNRTATKTRSVEVQTNITLIKESKQIRYRRRNSSSSSSSSSVSRSSRYSGGRRRNDSDSSCSSRSSGRSVRSVSSSSSYSSRSSSRSSRSRSKSPRKSRKRRSSERERLREVEERRVIYVGRITSSTSRDDLRKRFQKFGPITNVSLHFRDHGDNYGFVTFANKLDAYEAIEHGNDDPYLMKYDLSFGGRRIFCKTSYSDLDNMREEASYFAGARVTDNSFDNLLREAQEKLRKRKA